MPPDYFYPTMGSDKPQKHSESRRIQREEENYFNDYGSREIVRREYPWYCTQALHTGVKMWAINRRNRKSTQGKARRGEAKGQGKDRERQCHGGARKSQTREGQNRARAGKRGAMKGKGKGNSKLRQGKEIKGGGHQGKG